MSALPQDMSEHYPRVETTNGEGLPDLRELAVVSRTLETKPATSAIGWAADRFDDGLVLASSFQDSVLIDLAVQVRPDIEVIFLDTQYHFDETLEYVETVRARYDLNLKVMTPTIEPDDRWMEDPDGCCGARKVVPMARALAGKRAWMTGLRRDEAVTRANAAIVSWDVSRGLVKVNPIAPWSDHDVEQYARDRGLPEHPLRDQGFTSIGCWPCTRPVEEGEHARSGRWAGRDKVECGLHVQRHGIADYRRPSWFFRHIANPLWTALGLATTLAVPGRSTGEWRTVPIHVLELDGARYLVAPRGQTEWVRNLRAAGTGVLRRRGDREPFRATEVPVAERPPIIAAYRDRWDREVKVHFTKMPDPAQHPVFRVEAA